MERQMRSVNELRRVVAEYFFCGDTPMFFASLGDEFIRFWDKMNALSTRGMSMEEWKNLSRNSIDDRKILTQEEFDALFGEARSLKVE